MMNKQVLIVGLLMISAISFGQKKEIKNAIKATKSAKYTEAASFLKQAEGMLGSADDEMKSQYYAALGSLNLASGANNIDKLNAAGEAFNESLKISPKGKSSSIAKDGILDLRVAVENKAKKSYGAKDYLSAAKSYYAVYNFGKSDTVYLYNAAVCSKLAKNNDLSLAYYQELIDIKYTGIAKEFVATDKNTGKIKPFASKKERDDSVKSGSHIKPETRNSNSVQNDIFRNLTAIYIDKGENDKALTILNDLIAKSPDDVDLLNIATNMYYKLGDIDKFNELTSRLIELNPNDENLYFNLGVTSSKNGELEKAKEYYKKALEINPEYSGALTNLGNVILARDAGIQEEFNNLGTSRADDLIYDKLKAERKTLYGEVIPYFEKSFNIENSVDVGRLLMNLYSFIGEDDKFKAMKEKVATMTE